MPQQDIEKYVSIINMPRHISDSRPKMTLLDRAAQFSPFAALTGFDDEISETARITDSRLQISEEMQEKIDRELRYINLHINEEPKVRITYFKCDSRKDGGKYITEDVFLKKIDTVKLAVVLTDGRKIAVDDITDIKYAILKTPEPI